MNSLLSACTEFKKHNTTARKIPCQISHSRQITSASISLDDPPKSRPGTLPWTSANWTLADQDGEGNPVAFPYKSQPKPNLDYLCLWAVEEGCPGEWVGGICRQTQILYFAWSNKKHRFHLLCFWTHWWKGLIHTNTFLSYWKLIFWVRDSWMRGEMVKRGVPK